MNYQPRGISDQALQGPASYAGEMAAAKALLETQPTWNGVTAEAVARMRLQNRFKTGLDIARYTAALIEELYTFLRQADSRELNDTFRALDAARKAGDQARERALIEKIDNFQTHVVPVIADIDAGFGNAEATYLLAKRMIEAGACALQI